MQPVLRSPYRHFDHDLQEQVQDGTSSVLKAVHIQTNRLKRAGQDIPPALSYAQKTFERRVHERRID